jgi:hypothetical protein
MVDVKQKLETVILIPTRVKLLREEFQPYNWRKTQDGQSECDQRSLGWWATFDGSREALFVGHEKPAHLSVNDSVFIAIQKPVRIR